MEPIPVVQIQEPETPARVSPYQVDGVTPNRKHNANPAPLYSGLPFFVRLIEGRFQSIRRWISAPLMAVFFLTVWLEVDGQPAVLFSYDTQRILIWGHSLSWHDLPLLAGMLITAAMLLFFAAVAWGRVWCGFACPQSVWTWMFLRIETLTLGQPGTRKRREREQPAEHQVRNLLKHLLWILLALATAFTFTGYFVPARELAGQLGALELGTGSMIWLTVMTLLTYVNAGFVREKICLHACPYSRFQSVMFDSHTRTVAYDEQRGEPRQRRSRSDTTATSVNEAGDNDPGGDCVDCGLCVHVCPVGIDIRDGLQAPCIDCGACIDACDRVMAKIKRPLGLIRFATEAELKNGKDYQSPLLRPRLIGYGTVCIGAILAVVIGFQNTTRLLVEVRRDRDQLYTWQDDAICNHYRIKVERFDGGQNALDPIRIAVKSNAGSNWQLSGITAINSQDLSNQWLRYKVCSPGDLPYRSDIAFDFSTGDHQVQKETTFISANR